MVARLSAIQSLSLSFQHLSNLFFFSFIVLMINSSPALFSSSRTCVFATHEAIDFCASCYSTREGARESKVKYVLRSCLDG